MVCNVFYWRKFAKFSPENYGFDLFEGFFMEKMSQIHQILKGNFQNRQFFYDKFQYVAKCVVKLFSG
jgi:hypothetical protein